MNIYIANLGFNVNDDSLHGLFKDFANVSSAKVIADKFTSQSRGFAFVEISDENATQNAVKELDGVMIEGRSNRYLN